MKTMIPTTRHFGEKANERRERKENQNSNIPMMETRVIHPMRMAKERADMTKENPRRSSLHMPVGQTKTGINHGNGTNKAGAHFMRSSTGQALMAFHDAYEHHEKEAIHEKLIQSDAVSEHNLSVTTDHRLLVATKLAAPVINPQHNPMPAFYSGHRTHERPHLLSVQPGRDQVHLCKRRNSQGKLDLASPISHNNSTQYQHRRARTRNCTDPPQHQSDAEPLHDHRAHTSM